MLFIPDYFAESVPGGFVRGFEQQKFCVCDFSCCFISGAGSHGAANADNQSYGNKTGYARLEGRLSGAAVPITISTDKVTSPGPSDLSYLVYADLV